MAPAPRRAAWILAGFPADRGQIFREDPGDLRFWGREVRLRGREMRLGSWRVRLGVRGIRLGVRGIRLGVREIRLGVRGTPAGANVCPAGANVCPAGASVSPAGANVSPAGASVSPAGANVCPAGAGVLWGALAGGWTVGTPRFEAPSIPAGNHEGTMARRRRGGRSDRVPRHAWRAQVGSGPRASRAVTVGVPSGARSCQSQQRQGWRGRGVLAVDDLVDPEALVGGDVTQAEGAVLVGGGAWALSGEKVRATTGSVCPSRRPGSVRRGGPTGGGGSGRRRWSEGCAAARSRAACVAGPAVAYYERRTR